jgi:hypothetical protein
MLKDAGAVGGYLGIVKGQCTLVIWALLAGDGAVVSGFGSRRGPVSPSFTVTKTDY